MLFFFSSSCLFFHRPLQPRIQSYSSTKMASRESDIIHANILNNKEKDEEEEEEKRRESQDMNISPAVQYSSSPVYFLYIA